MDFYNKQQEIEYLRMRLIACETMYDKAIDMLLAAANYDGNPEDLPQHTALQAAAKNYNEEYCADGQT